MYDIQTAHYKHREVNSRTVPMIGEQSSQRVVYACEFPIPATPGCWDCDVWR